MAARRDLDVEPGALALSAGPLPVAHLAGSPFLVALLIAIGTAWPFAAQSVLLLAGAILVTRVVLLATPRRRATPPHREVVEALR